MDQVTQIALGAAAAQAVGTSALGRKAAVAGGLAALLPDLDMALEPFADPLFPVELHRSFTHGLVLVPAIAAVATLSLLPFRSFRSRWFAVFGVAAVGALTHAPLDILTSYGTQILWPFSTEWVALDVLPMIDPAFTLVLVVGIAWAALRARPRPARVALLLACVYVALGVVQHGRALDAQAVLAEARGHQPTKARVMPAFVGPLVWRSLYVADGRIHADAIRLAPIVDATAQAGGSAERIEVADLPDVGPDAGHHRAVLARYARFTHGYTARAPGDETVVADVRFSLGYGIDPLWGIRIAPPQPPSWVDWMRVRMSDPEGTIRHIAALSFGTVGDFQSLPK